MVSWNIITPEAVWEERRTREDSWLHSAGWLIRVIKRTRRRRKKIHPAKLLDFSSITPEAVTEVDIISL